MQNYFDISTVIKKCAKIQRKVQKHLEVEWGILISLFTVSEKCVFNIDNFLNTLIGILTALEHNEKGS